MSATPGDDDHDHDHPTVNESPFPVPSEDPTATTSLRNRYSAEMFRRFRALKGAIVTGVIERDAFGLRGLSPEERAGPRTPARATVDPAPNRDLAANPLGPPEDPDRFDNFDECVDTLADDPDLSREDAEEICGAWEARVNMKRGMAANQRRGGADPGINIEAPHAGQFAFPSDDRKIAEFLFWLGEQVDRGIMDADVVPGRTVAAQPAWMETYLRQAYAKGVNHADAFLVDAGVIPRGQTLDDVFRNVKHSDAAGMIYTRAYNELDGVTDAMGQEMSRTLADGLTRGHNPNRIGRDLNDRVDNIGIERGRLVARTETIRAHNEAALNRYEDMGDRIAGVTAMVEFATAGDERVCPICRDLGGQTFTIRDARGRIPVHPRCRCTWVPVV